MGESLFWIYIFNVIVNSTISFISTILLVELFTFIFRVQHPRLKAICRALPFIKICFDLNLYHLSDWALLHGVNPLLAEVGTRQLSILFNPFIEIQFSMLDGKTFSIADVLALSFVQNWVKLISSVAFLGSGIAIAIHLLRTYQNKLYASGILRCSRPISFPDINPSLKEWLKKKQIIIAASNEVTSPCIISSTILFSESLIAILSQEEVSAVIAHEIAHYHWKDCFLRRFCGFVGSIFWWIPTSWWQKRMEDMQEQASDTMICHFGISQFSLAEAVLKTAKNVKNTKCMYGVPFVGQRQALHKRIVRICSKQKQVSAKWKIIQCSLVFSGLLSILLGRFCIL